MSQSPQVRTKKVTGFKRKADYTSRWTKAPRGQMGGTIQKIQQVTNLGYLTITNADAFGAFSFKLADLPNSADLQGVYDMYRFVKIVVHFIPLNNAIDIKDPSSTLQAAGVLYSSKDYNDVTVPVNASEVASYQTCKFTPTYDKHIRSIKPKLIPQDLESQAVINFTPTNPWVPTVNDNAIWAGLKFAINHSPDNSRIKYQVLCYYHIEFKNVK